MAKTIQVERRGYTLVPENPWSLELLEGFPEGKPLAVELKTARSRGELNLYWAGLTVLVDNFDAADEQRWPTARKYHDAMLDSLGYSYKLWRLDGTDLDGNPIYSFKNQVDSVALDAMSDEEFKVLFERVRGITVKLFGYDPWDAWKQMKDDEKANRRDWRQHR